MKHKIVFLDMDGTLYQTENDIIQDSALDAIQMLKDKGYKVCAATGRPLNQMKLILERVEFDDYVLINGSYILDKDFNEIGAYPIEKETVEELVQLCKDHKFGLMFHFGDATYIYNDFYPMYYFCKYCNVLDSLFYDQTETFHKRHRVFNAVIMTKDKTSLDAFMKEHPNLRSDLINVKTDGFCFDIFNADNDKSKGIELVLNKNNMTWKDTICIGDSTNDIGMLEKADIGVAMGSATDYVKSFANWSTTSTYENGIFNAVAKILKEEDN
ncbi:MAG: HAD family hydrolase [Faecalicoccus sp.]|uniref:HAD family hydrolase n=1 Tax=Faecalicoccus sp. TaxID=1971758 RepID=UPI002F95388F